MRITFELDIDEAEWARRFPEDELDLQSSVTGYARHVVDGLFVDLGLARS